MKRAIILLLAIAAIAATSCSRWRIPDSDNKYLSVLKRDGNLVKTKTRLASDLRVEAANQDSVVSSVSNGKATVTTIVLKGVTIPAKTKGKIVEEEDSFYFVVNDKDLRKKVGRIPLNIEKDGIFIRTSKNVMVGTRLAVDSNSPGFELRIKEDEKTISIAANN